MKMCVFATDSFLNLEPTVYNISFNCIFKVNVSEVCLLHEIPFVERLRDTVINVGFRVETNCCNSSFRPGGCRPVIDGGDGFTVRVS